jgi:dihydrofolate reductase
LKIEPYRPEIVLILARAENGVIGADGWMPWHLPDDLKRFKRMTVGKPVIMGRKTFETFGKPLPARHNIVMTRQEDWTADGVTVAANLAEAIAAAGLNPKARAPVIFVAGGAEIYRLALPSATRIELTEVHAAPEGDTVFDDLKPGDWTETFRERHEGPNGQPDYSFVTLVRRGD